MKEIEAIDALLVEYDRELLPEIQGWCNAVEDVPACDVKRLTETFVQNLRRARALLADRAALVAENERLRAEYLEYVTRRDAQFGEHMSQISALVARNEELRDANDTVEQCYANAKSLIDALEADILERDARIEALRREAAKLVTARPREEWHEDMGPVTWWLLPVAEPARVGTPLDNNFPDYLTHFTPHPPIPEARAALPAPAEPPKSAGEGARLIATITHDPDAKTSTVVRAPAERDAATGRDCSKSDPVSPFLPLDAPKRPQ